MHLPKWCFIPTLLMLLPTVMTKFNPIAMFLKKSCFGGEISSLQSVPFKFAFLDGKQILYFVFSHQILNNCSSLDISSCWHFSKYSIEAPAVERSGANFDSWKFKNFSALYLYLYLNVFVFVFEAILVFVLVGKWLGAIVTAQTGHWPIPADCQAG